MDVSALALRTPFRDEEGLLDYLVEHRHHSLPKMSEALKLSVYDIRALLSSRDFRRRCTERLSLNVLTMEREERLLLTISDEAVMPETKLRDRIAAAEFLTRHAGLERARETKVDVDVGVRVTFDALPKIAAGYRPPDPFIGVVGRPALPKGEADLEDRTIEAVVANPHETQEPDDEG